jgi:hypothetical protein
LARLPSGPIPMVAPFILSLVFSSWRHHPADALPRRLLLAVVGSQISPLPAAHSATAAALDVLQNFISLKAINRQPALMMTGPIAFALADPMCLKHQIVAASILRCDAGHRSVFQQNFALCRENNLGTSWRDPVMVVNYRLCRKEAAKLAASESKLQ